MAEIKVLMVMTDDVNEPTLREFLRLGGYKLCTAYLQTETETPSIPTESQDIPTQPSPAQEAALGGEEEIPATLEHAVDILFRDNNREMMEAEFGENLQNRENFSAITHHSTGRNLRNAWKLWHKGTPLNQWFRNNLGIWHADDMSGIITDLFHARLMREPFDLAAEVERYKRHWRQFGINSIEDADKQNGEPE